MTVRVPYLDGLRALAILMVVCFHALQYHPWYAAHASPWWRLLVAQNQGVYLFFVLSGFCLAYPALAKLEHNGELDFDLARFVSRRILRIIPPYWIAIAVLATGIGILSHAGLQPGPATAPHVTPMKIAEQMLLFNLRPQWLNGSFWTLPTEVHWYFFFPALMWVWTRSPRAFAFLAILFCIAAVTTRFAGPDVQALPAFMMGIVAAQFRLRPHPVTRFAPHAFLFMVAAAIEPHLQRVPLHYAAWELAMFFLVLSANEVPAIGRAFTARALTPIAAASYSIYLIHAPVMSTIEKYAPSTAPVGVVLFCSAILGIAAGWMFSLVAERPFRRGPARDAILGYLDERMPQVLHVAGIGQFLRLTSAPRIISSDAVTPPVSDVVTVEA